MATLFNTKISDTYEGLIKTSNNGVIGAVEQNLTDGSGNASTLSIGTSSASFTGTLDLTNATVVGLSSGAVDSVNGQTGVVVLTTTNINEGTNLYFTDARVEANSAVTLNTAKVGITTSQSDAIVLNTAKVGITPTQANEIAANTLKVGITTSQASDITANNVKVTFPEAPNDGQQYARQSQGWSVVTGGGGGAVDSVNGQTGTVVLDTDNINEGTTNLYYTDSRVSANSSVALNTAKVGITTAQADDIVLNTAKVGITSSQATAITNNTAKNSYPTADANKLAGIETGAEVNDVDSVNGLTGAVSLGLLDLDDVGADGAIGQVLTTDGSGAFTFTTVSSGGGGVSSVTGTGSVSGLTLTTGGTAANITLTLGGTLSLTSGNVTSALGFTPYSNTNPDNYITGIDSSDVTTALGFTPYNSTNPAGYITTYTVTSGDVTGALGFTPYNATNPDNFISTYTVTSSDVTTALGFTPYNNTNPSNFTSNLGIVQSVTGNTGVLEIVNGVLNVPPTSGAPVDSVNGATGVVVLDTDNIAEGTTNKYMVLGTTSSTALAGNTDLLQIGLTSTTALAGDTTTISGSQATAITDNSAKVGFTQALVSLNTDVIDNTAKVGNVQSDWNATTGLAVILNKPSIPSAAPVDSVNGEVGTVVLDTSDIAENTNLYFTDARVSANSAVTLNTAKVGITSAQAADITDNNTKVSMVIGTAANEAMAGNTTVITSSQATAITNNTAKNSYPSADATKLAGIDDNAQVNVQSNWNVTDTNSDAFIQNKPTIPSAAPVDSVNAQTGTVVLTTANISEVTNLYYTEARVSANTNVSDNTAKISFDSTASTKLNGIEAGAQVNTVDSVNGNVGAVTLTTSDVAEGTNKYMVLGTTASTALAGDTTIISAQQATDIANNTTKLNNIEAGAEVNTIDSSVSGEPTGSDQVINVVSLTQAEYDAGTPVATTLYIIT